MKIKFCVIITAFILFGCSPGKPEPENQSDFIYPETRMTDQTDIYFGIEVADPYRWLEDDKSEETSDWVEAQNAITFSYLESIPFREKVRNRLQELLDFERIYAPEKHGDYYYFLKNDGLQNQNVLYRKKGLDAKEEVFLDPNSFSKDGTISLAGTSFSTDGSLMGYLISEGGSDWNKAIIIETDSKEMIGDTLRNLKFSSLSWKDNDGFFYSSYDKPEEGAELTAQNQHHKLFYHKLNTSQADDRLIFGGEDQPRLLAIAEVTEDSKYLIVVALQSTSGNELYILDLNNPDAQLTTIVDNFDNEHLVLDVVDGRIIIQTNLDAPNSRVVEVDIKDPVPENWKDIIPESDDVLSASTAGGDIFASYLEDAKTIVKQFDNRGNFIRDVSLPGIGTAFGFSANRDDDRLFYTFTSFTYPNTIYSYDINSGQSNLYIQPKIDFNPDEYETKQVFYSSKDGTEVPMFIVYKKGIELNGKNPTYLYSYGGFNINLVPNFNISRVVWLENGGIYAQPNIRGGGEYGEDWHQAGTRMNKQNVFDDFIAAGEYLIANNYTDSEHLAIAGGSNGGLLIGATMTQRPDLARVAFPAVGVMDMLRYQEFTVGSAWKDDYGTSDESEQMFKYLLGYSPLHNLEEGVNYPATMVTTADHDDRVVPAHSFKFAATLQEKHGGNAPVLIRIETDAGHGSGTPISKTIEQEADKYSFAWYNMGVVPEKLKEDM